MIFEIGVNTHSREGREKSRYENGERQKQNPFFLAPATHPTKRRSEVGARKKRQNQKNQNQIKTYLQKRSKAHTHKKREDNLHSETTESGRRSRIGIPCKTLH